MTQQSIFGAQPSSRKCFASKMREGCASVDFLYLFSLMDDLKALWPFVNPQAFNLSTMTVIAQTTEPTKIKLSNVEDMEQEHLAHMLQVRKIHECCPAGTLRLVREKKRQQKQGQFGNQATLEFHSTTNRSIKIFGNGKLHMTGCKNLAEFEGLEDVIGGLLFAVGAADYRLQYEAPRVQMLNVNFSLDCELSLQALWKVIREEYQVPVTHETDTHPALQVRFSFATVMIFRSGNVLVSSRAALEGVLASFRLICQLVNDKHEIVGARVNLRKRRSVKQPNVMDGYPVGQALPCYASQCPLRKKHKPEPKCGVERPPSSATDAPASSE